MTWRDIEQRKEATFSVRRLDIWLKKEEITHDVLSQKAIDVIRIVLAGELK